MYARKSLFFSSSSCKLQNFFLISYPKIADTLNFKCPLCGLIIIPPNFIRELIFRRYPFNRFLCLQFLTQTGMLFIVGMRTIYIFSGRSGEESSRFERMAISYDSKLDSKPISVLILIDYSEEAEFSTH